MTKWNAKSSNSRVQEHLDYRVTQCLRFVSTGPDFAHIGQMSTSIFRVKTKILWKFSICILFNERVNRHDCLPISSATPGTLFWAGCHRSTRARNNPCDVREKSQKAGIWALRLDCRRMACWFRSRRSEPTSAEQRNPGRQSCPSFLASRHLLPSSLSFPRSLPYIFRKDLVLCKGMAPLHC